MTYIAISAIDKSQNKRVVIGGTDDFSKIERFYREDLSKLDPRYTELQEHTDYDSFAHAIWCIEQGFSVEAARTQLALRGY